MSVSVSIRDLRNDGGRVLDRVERGESITITRNGRPVAELRPLPRRALSLAELDNRFATLLPMDEFGFRRDVDALIDPLP
ncbi:MAG TPA: type II toxin-antitoxin system prevent-host-death family antitoxin [Candidatus Dormibacteraeota bacterium]|nr:type II toxin-antitoxin system prevent-host-death family antitoxin [Candidatus Dormibacteraeota bacterium]